MSRSYVCSKELASWISYTTSDICVVKWNGAKSSLQLCSIQYLVAGAKGQKLVCADLSVKMSASLLPAVDRLPPCLAACICQLEYSTWEGEDKDKALYLPPCLPLSSDDSHCAIQSRRAILVDMDVRTYISDNVLRVSASACRATFV